MAGRILIVDPVPTNRMVLKAKLALAHYDVSVADGVGQARALADRHMFEAVLVSSALVDLSPDCVLDWMRKTRADKNVATTFIFMQDDTDAAHECGLLTRSLQAGADDVLNRPFSEEVLLARIRNLMRDNAYSRELHLPALQQSLPLVMHNQADEAPVKIVTTHVSSGQSSRFGAQILACIRNLNQAISGPDKVEAVPLSMLTQPDAAPAEPEIVLLVAQDEARDQTLSIMSQMLSRTRMQDVRVIVIFQSPSPDQTARAFDLGAHDVVSLDLPAPNLVARIKIQAQICRIVRRRKRGVREGLRQAMLDPLTGLYNRRYAANRLPELQRECQNSGMDFAVLAFDVDHFKDVNDRYGHTVGDQVLTTLAKTLRLNLREEDLICRTGGEEFLVALPKTSKDQASTTADRLRKAVGGLEIVVKGSLMPLRITVSIGLSVQDGHVPIPDMLEQADRALYQAKARGRNVVAIAAAA